MKVNVIKLNILVQVQPRNILKHFDTKIHIQSEEYLWACLTKEAFLTLR